MSYTPEFSIRSDFLKEGIVPELGIQDPLRVVQSTKRNFELRLSGQVDPEPIDQYFQEVTLPYLDRVTSAVDVYFDPTRPRIRSLSYDFTSTQSPDDEEYTRASVDYFAIIFNAIPDEFRPSYLPMGYSRRLEMAPPRTPSEMKFRVQEIGQTIRSFMTGTHGVADLGVTKHHTPSIRTLAFLRVGSSLPIHAPATENETLDLYADALKDVDISVPDSEYHLHQVELANKARQERTSFNNLLKDVNLD